MAKGKGSYEDAEDEKEGKSEKDDYTSKTPPKGKQIDDDEDDVKKVPVVPIDDE